MWATRARLCSDDAESSRLQLKLEERELGKSRELDDLDLALFFQRLLLHFCVPQFILDATGNQWGTKGLNFLLHEAFRCLRLGRACPPSSGCQPAVVWWGLPGCHAGGQTTVLLCALPNAGCLSAQRRAVTPETSSLGIKVQGEVIKGDHPCVPDSSPPSSQRGQLVTPGRRSW